MNAATDPAHDALRAACAALSASKARSEGFARFMQTGLPHRRMEAWKWTDLRRALSAPAVSPVPTGLTVFAAPQNALTLHFKEGRLVTGPTLPEGLHLRTTQGETQHSLLHMAVLASALAPLAYRLDVATSPQRPLHFDFTGAGHAQLSVDVAAGVRVVLIEDHGTNDGFSNRAVDFTLAPGAFLIRLLRQSGSDSAVQVVTAHVRLAEKARLEQFSLSLGARLSRLQTRIDYGGADARARLNGATLLGAARHGDQTFFVDHAQPRCTTRQVMRTAVRERGRGVFQGKFYVARGGQQSDADMAHDAILLNEGASVNAKPELEIYADDVACTHGNTCGALDESALFYMRQRGLSEAQARALLIKAFAGAAFDDLPDEDLRALMMVPVQNWLEAAR